MSDRPARRVTVTSPRTRAPRRPPGGGVTREIDEQTRLGEVYMRALVRSQLRLALRVFAVFAVVLGGMPLMFTVLPGAREVHLLGLPLPWLLLGALVYPVFVVGAWLYVRQAERIERDFADLVKHS